MIITSRVVTLREALGLADPLDTLYRPSDKCAGHNILLARWEMRGLEPAARISDNDGIRAGEKSALSGVYILQK